MHSEQTMEKLKPFKIQKDVTGNAEMINYCRKRIDTWAQRFSAGALQGLGQKIDITSITQFPVYRVKLLSQYEKRALSNQHRPFKGEQPAQPTVTNTQQVDAWRYNLKSISNFAEHDYRYTVQGSEYTKTCAFCKGKKETTCQTCQGGGKVGCSKCDQTGKMRCTDCWGNRYYRCPDCSGSGQIRQKRRCGSCGGVGQTRKYRNDGSSVMIRCPSCGGRGSSLQTQNCSACAGRGKISCKNCGGTGKETCNLCHGKTFLWCGPCNHTGIVTCEACAGSGTLVYYIELRQHFFHDEQIKIVSAQALTDQYADVLSKLDHSSGQQIYTGKQSLFTEDHLQESGLFAPFLKTLCRDANGKYTDTDTMINFQELSISKSDVYDLCYKYQGKSYHLIIMGDGRLHVPAANPVAEMGQTHYHNAQHFLEKGKLAASLRELQSAKRIDVENRNRQIPVLFEEIKTKFLKAYRVGAFTGAVLSVVLFGLLSYLWLQSPRFILPWLNQLYQSTAWMQSIHVFIIPVLLVPFGLFSYKKTIRLCDNQAHVKIEKGLYRLLAAVAVAVFFTVVAWLFLLVINSSGLLLLITVILKPVIPIAAKLFTMLKEVI
ncbi:MAG: hypothetical protein GF313_13700 [Caldithrix sp.]|nr:hypothetical protein [Caldithrix sp.]